MRNQLLPKFKTERSQHGGSLKNPQKRKRPLSFRARNHFVLRSTKAKGVWSFRKHKHEISVILQKFAKRHHIGLQNSANVGNHIHLSLECGSRKQYVKFIRAVSAAIMMKVTGYSRWNKAPEGFQFWDARPFSRIVASWKELKTLDKYIVKNQLEGRGAMPEVARWLADMGWSGSG